MEKRAEVAFLKKMHPSTIPSKLFAENWRKVLSWQNSLRKSLKKVDSFVKLAGEQKTVGKSTDRLFLSDLKDFRKLSKSNPLISIRCEFSEDGIFKSLIKANLRLSFFSNESYLRFLICKILQLRKSHMILMAIKKSETAVFLTAAKMTQAFEETVAVG